jgi:hypothetical protein
MDPFEKNSNSIEYEFKIEKITENEPKSEIYTKMFDEDSFGKEKSNSAEKFSNANNLSENHSYELGNTTNKTAHQKIFKTTVIQRKKSVNFKVIKNKERDSGNPNSQNEINHYEKINNNNKNNFNNYFIEEQNNSNTERRISFFECENTNKEGATNCKVFPNKLHNSIEMNLIPFNEVKVINKFNFGSNHQTHQSCFTATPNEINITKTEIHSSNLNKNQGFTSIFPKKLKRETYIDILIKAADRISQLGYFSIENQMASIASMNSDISLNDEIKFKPASILTEKEFSHESFLNENKNKIDIEHIEITSQKINYSSDPNSNESMSNSNQMDCDETSNEENKSSGIQIKNKAKIKSFSNSKIN